jgi:hypothetical protein
MIDPKEITSITTLGHVDEDEVKLISTKGGFHLAILQGAGGPVALAAGSHPAIVRFQVESKQPGFRQALAKSEGEAAVFLFEKNRPVGDTGLKMTGVQDFFGNFTLAVSAADVEVGLFKAEYADGSFKVTNFHLDASASGLKKQVVQAASRSLLKLCKSLEIGNIDVSALEKRRG